MVISMYIFCFFKKAVQIDHKPVQVFVRGLFLLRNQLNMIQFVNSLETLLPNANQLIQAYFNHRLLQKPFNQFLIPKIQADSILLYKEWFVFFGLACSDLHKYESVTQIYNSLTLNYQEFYDHIIGPKTLILAVFYE